MVPTMVHTAFHKPLRVSAMSTPHVDSLPFWPKGASGVIPPLPSPEMLDKDIQRHQRIYARTRDPHRVTTLQSLLERKGGPNSTVILPPVLSPVTTALGPPPTGSFFPSFANPDSPVRAVYAKPLRRAGSAGALSLSQSQTLRADRERAWKDTLRVEGVFAIDGSSPGPRLTPTHQPRSLTGGPGGSPSSPSTSLRAGAAATGKARDRPAFDWGDDGEDARPSHPETTPPKVDARKLPGRPQFASPKAPADPHRLHLDLVRARQVLEADHALASSRYAGAQGTPREGVNRAWREAAAETSALAARLSRVLAALEAKKGGNTQ